MNFDLFSNQSLYPLGQRHLDFLGEDVSGLNHVRVHVGAEFVGLTAAGFSSHSSESQEVCETVSGGGWHGVDSLLPAKLDRRALSNWLAMISHGNVQKTNRVAQHRQTDAKLASDLTYVETAQSASADFGLAGGTVDAGCHLDGLGANRKRDQFRPNVEPVIYKLLAGDSALGALLDKRTSADRHRPDATDPLADKTGTDADQLGQRPHRVNVDVGLKVHAPNIALLNDLVQQYLTPMQENLVMHIGSRIKLAMGTRGITTKAMAEKCGVTPGAVSNWFSTGRITKDNLARVADLLRVDILDLISGDIGDEALSPTRKPLSPEARDLGQWLDRITDKRGHTRARDLAMVQILNVLSGLDIPPTHTPSPSEYPETDLSKRQTGVAR